MKDETKMALTSSKTDPGLFENHTRPSQASTMPPELRSSTSNPTSPSAGIKNETNNAVAQNLSIDHEYTEEQCDTPITQNYTESRKSDLEDSLFSSSPSNLSSYRKAKFEREEQNMGCATHPPTTQLALQPSTPPSPLYQPSQTSASPSRPERSIHKTSPSPSPYPTPTSILKVRKPVPAPICTHCDKPITADKGNFYYTVASKAPIPAIIVCSHCVVEMKLKGYVKLDARTLDQPLKVQGTKRGLNVRFRDEKDSMQDTPTRSPKRSRSNETSSFSKPSLSPQCNSANNVNKVLDTQKVHEAHTAEVATLNNRITTLKAKLAASTRANDALVACVQSERLQSQALHDDNQEKTALLQKAKANKAEFDAKLSRFKALFTRLELKEWKVDLKDLVENLKGPQEIWKFEGEQGMAYVLLHGVDRDGDVLREECGDGNGDDGRNGGSGGGAGILDLFRQCHELACEDEEEDEDEENSDGDYDEEEEEVSGDDDEGGEDEEEDSNDDDIDNVNDDEEKEDDGNGDDEDDDDDAEVKHIEENEVTKGDQAEAKEEGKGCLETSRLWDDSPRNL